jgi:hypothetical protein
MIAVRGKEMGHLFVIAAASDKTDTEEEQRQ